MIGFLITLLVIGLVVGLVWWVMDYLPVPEPFNKIIKLVCVVVFVIYVIYALLGLGHVDMPKIG
jgi:multisubunit Na+/H+ antiporter MnhB subunit